MDRRLSNVQLQLRRESDMSSISSWDSGRSSSIAPSTAPPFGRDDDDAGDDGAPKHPSAIYRSEQQHQQPNKRRRATLWETLADWVCSLGALATRAAKMAAKKNEAM